MNRKSLLFVLCLLLTLALGPAALAQDASEGWVCPEGFEGQTLNFYNWATYVAEDTIPNFEAACGVTVVSSFFGNNEELLSVFRIENPGYDVAVPSDYAVSIMVAEGLLEPLPEDGIPNMANVNADLLDGAFDPGNVYSLPYQWGTVGVGYDVNAVAEVLGEGVEITSWEQVFDYPERSVIWIDDARIMIGIALDYLGYEPNTRNLDELEEAKNFLIEKGRNTVLQLAADNGQELLAAGEADLVIEYNGDIVQIAAACEENPDCGTSYNYVIPEEGSNVWIDNLVIPVDAPNPELAAVFIDYILDAQAGADISNYTGYASPNQASVDLGLIDAAALENPTIYPASDQVQTLFTLLGFTDAPDIEQAYNDAWTAIRIELGQ